MLAYSNRENTDQNVVTVHLFIRICCFQKPPHEDIWCWNRHIELKCVQNQLFLLNHKIQILVLKNQEAIYILYLKKVKGDSVQEFAKRVRNHSKNYCLNSSSSVDLKRLKLHFCSKQICGWFK